MVTFVCPFPKSLLIEEKFSGVFEKWRSTERFACYILSSKQISPRSWEEVKWQTTPISLSEKFNENPPLSDQKLAFLRGSEIQQVGVTFGLPKVTP